MTEPLRGCCACRAVRLELTPPTIFASYCHCQTCRRVHAAPFVAWTAVPREALRLVAESGEVTEYASSPGTIRAFCRRCGTALLYRSEQSPARIYVPVAILDRLDRPLESHVSYEERAPWLQGLHELPCFVAKSDEPLGWT